jgi:hypothetical protein
MKTISFNETFRINVLIVRIKRDEMKCIFDSKKIATHVRTFHQAPALDEWTITTDLQNASAIQQIIANCAFQ